MTLVTLRPNGTVGSVGGGGTVLGAASAHAALSDDSDASAVLYSPGQGTTLDLANLSLPAGAVIRTIRVRARLNTLSQSFAVASAAASVSHFAGGALSVTNTVPLTIAFDPVGSDWSDGEVDAVAMVVGSQVGSLDDLVVYEAYLDVTYVEMPTLTVDAPVDPVTDTNLPLVEWTPTFDPDAGSLSFWQVKVFTDAQYGVGGFDPETSPATYGRGVGGGVGTGGDATSHQIVEILPDDTYRAYVKVGRSNNILEPHYSDWEYIEFEVDVALPAEPTIVATGDDANGRIEIAVSDNAGAATTDLLELQRSLDGGTTWESVRTALGLVDSLGAPDQTAYDYESPNGVATQYRARALHDYSGAYAASAWATASATWASGEWWLKHPNLPELNLPVELVTYGDVMRGARQGVFQPLGALLPVVVSDSRAGATGASTVRTRSTAARDALQAIAAYSATLLLQGPVVAGEPDRYVRVGNLSMARLIENVNRPIRTFSLPWVEVALPGGALVPRSEEVPAGALEALTSLEALTMLDEIGVA